MLWMDFVLKYVVKTIISLLKKEEKSINQLYVLFLVQYAVPFTVRKCVVLQIKVQ